MKLKANEGISTVFSGLRYLKNERLPSKSQSRIYYQTNKRISNKTER